MGILGGMTHELASCAWQEAISNAIAQGSRSGLGSHADRAHHGPTERQQSRNEQDVLNFAGVFVSFYHRIYGLRVAANRAIPGLLLLADPGDVDLHVHMKGAPAFPLAVSQSSARDFYISPYCNDAGQPCLRVAALADGAYIGFFYGDGVHFAVDRQGREVWVNWPEGYSIEDAATYLLGPVLGFVLRLKGIIPLHASAVALEDQAIAFVGAGGAGKSTTAAGFAHLGVPVLSDDVVPLKDAHDQFLVVPGYPRVNLWPDSVRALLGSEDALPRITPTWGKHYLPLDRNNCLFESRLLPLGAVYLLGERDPALAAPRIEEIPAGEALLALVANTYVNYVLDREMRRREFELLSRLVAHVPVRSIRSSDDPSKLRILCQAIAEDARRSICLSPAAAAPGAR